MEKCGIVCCMETTPYTSIITVNGETREVPRGTTLSMLLDALEIVPELVAAELDGRIVAKENFSTTVLSQGSVLELVRFVGGGAC